MVTIPLYTFLFVYLVFLAIFTVFSMINLYHIIMTASFTLASFFTTFIIFAIVVLVFYFTWLFLQGVNWQTPVTLFNSEWISGIFNF